MNIPSFLDTIVIDPKARCNTNYVKARYAIEDAFKSRSDKRSAKQVIIDALHGTIVHKPHTANVTVVSHNVVAFPDGSRAQY